MTTIRYISYDIKAVLKTSFPDAEFTGNSIIFWISTFINFIMYRHLQGTKTGAYLMEFENVPIATDGIRYYFALPASIFDIEYEQGINYITYNEGNTVVQFSQAEANRVPNLYWNPYTTPTAKNPYFYRVNTNVYILGVPPATKTLQVGLFSAVETRPDYINIDAPILLNEEQVKDVREMVLQLGRFALLTPKDRIEQGSDDKQESLQNFAKATQPNQQVEPTQTQ